MRPAWPNYDKGNPEMTTPIAAVPSQADARALFNDIRAKAESAGTHLILGLDELAGMTKLVITAYTSEAWKAAGYTSWKACCDAEFEAIRLLRLPRSSREELHLDLKAAGLSIRETVAVTGRSKNTVHTDVSQNGTTKPTIHKPGTLGTWVEQYATAKLDFEVKAGALTVAEAETVRDAARILQRINDAGKVAA